MEFPVSKTVPEEIKVLCRQAKGIPKGRPHPFVRVHKDAQGNIGGYVWSSGVMDDLILYFDCNGKQFARFAIFGGDEYRKDSAAIGEFSKRFPVSKVLDADGNEKD